MVLSSSAYALHPRGQITYIDPPEKVVALAQLLAFEDFPKVKDIVVIARVESRFLANARNGISRGIMQVNRGPFEIAANMQAGVKLLREYYLQLGSEKAAVIAYNVGPGNYRKGRYTSHYWLKYKGFSDEYSYLERRTAARVPMDTIQHLAGGDLSDSFRVPLDEQADPRGLLLAEDWETGLHRSAGENYDSRAQH